MSGHSWLTYGRQGGENVSANPSRGRFTCQAAQDNPDQANSTVTFNPVKTSIVVTANQTTTVNIP
jgi:hypothetical protein